MYKLTKNRMKKMFMMTNNETRPIAISRVLRVINFQPTNRPTDQQSGLQSRVHATKERESALGTLYRLQNIGVRLVFGNIVPIAEIDNILPYRAVMSKIWYL